MFFSLRKYLGAYILKQFSHSLFFGKPRIAANGGLFPKSAIFGNASDYLNDIAKKQKRRFLLFHSIWQRFALREEGEFAPLYIMCAPIKGAKREKTPTAVRRAAVSP